MVKALRNGSMQFRVYLPHAQRVELVGTFTGWRDHARALRREPPGWWAIELEVSPGQHEFCYLVDGSIWLADYGASGVRMSRDGHWLSTLAVGAPALSAGPADTPDDRSGPARPERRAAPRRPAAGGQPPRDGTHMDPTPAPAGVF